MDDNKLLILAEHVSRIKKQVQELSTKAQTIEKAPGPSGKDGKDGRNGKDGVNGRDGRDGRDGVDGKDGKDGSDGVSVVNASIAADGSLVLTLSDGTEIDAGIIDISGKANNINILTQQGTGQSITKQPAISSVANNVSDAVIDIIYTQEESTVLTELRTLALEQKTVINNILTALRNTNIIA